MEPIVWLGVLGIIVPIIFGFIGWVINRVITTKIDALELGRKEDQELFFKRLDSIKDDIKFNYVPKAIYEQAMTFHQKEVDSKFNNLIETMTNNFKNVEIDIKEVKDLINSKFNGKTL